ncbi:hypothetical protein FE257_008287, partial [Aspergillus nanangensis]
QTQSQGQGPPSGGTVPRVLIQTPGPPRQAENDQEAQALLTQFVKSSGKQKKRPVGRPRSKSTRSEDTGLPGPAQNARIESVISISQSVVSEVPEIIPTARRQSRNQRDLMAPMSDPDKLIRKRVRREGVEEVMDSNVQLAPAMAPGHGTPTVDPYQIVYEPASRRRQQVVQDHT